MQAYSSVYTVERELKQELQRQEEAKQQKEDLEGRIHETELRIAKLTEKSQDSRQVQNQLRDPCARIPYLHASAHVDNHL